MIRNIYIHCVTCAIGTIQSLKSYFLLDHFKFLFETSHGPFKARRLPKDSPEITQVFPKNPRRLPGDQPETNQKPIGDLPETPEISNQPLGSLLKTFVRSLEGLLAITGDSLVCLRQLSIGPPVSLRRISGSSRCSMGSLWAVSSQSAVDVWEISWQFLEDVQIFSGEFPVSLRGVSGGSLSSLQRALCSFQVVYGASLNLLRVRGTQCI